MNPRVSSALLYLTFFGVGIPCYPAVYLDLKADQEIPELVFPKKPPDDLGLA